MNGEGRSKTNLGLNIGTMVSLIIAITVGGFIVANVYDITKNVERQSITNGLQTNKTLNQLVELQQVSNIRGNDSLILFKTLLENQFKQGNKTLQNQELYFPYFNKTFTILVEEIKNNSNRSVYNQEHYFKPYFNQSFEKIYKLLNATD